MRLLMTIAALAAFSLPISAADPEPIHILMASRVTANINGEEGAELSPWVVNINLMKDIKKNESGGLSESIVSYTVRFDKLKIDCVKYDASKSCWADAHHEVMQWYSLNWPVGVLEENGGVINLVPLKGKQKDDHYPNFKAERASIVAGWGPGWDHIGLDALRVNVGKPKVLREPYNPPGTDSKPYRRPPIEVEKCEPLPKKID